MAERKTYRSLRFYKPMGNGNGGAFQFRMSTKGSKDEPCLMIEACTQSGPKPPPGSTDSPFNWNDDKVVMMFNHNECGEIAAYVVGLQKSDDIMRNGMKLIHDQEREDGDNKSMLTFQKPAADNKWGNWGITIRRGDKGAKMFLTAGEALQVKTLCEAIVNRYVTEEITLNVPTTIPPDQRGGGRPY